MKFSFDIFLPQQFKNVKTSCSSRAVQKQAGLDLQAVACQPLCRGITSEGPWLAGCLLLLMLNLLLKTMAISFLHLQRYMFPFIIRQSSMGP